MVHQHLPETLIRISDLLKVDVNDLLNKECIKE